MGENVPSGKEDKAIARRRHALLVAGGVAIVAILYIIAATIIKPVQRVGHGPAGEAINTGPASVSDAAPGQLHQIPTLSAKGVGAMAPDVTFLDADNKPITLAAFRGKVVLVNLWATWCAPCKAEMPALAALQKSYAGKPFVVVALSIDSEKAAAKARAFIAENAPLKLYRDPDYGVPPAFTPPVLGVPASFFVDRQGHVRGQVNSDADWTGPKAKAAIDQLLAE